MLEDLTLIAVAETVCRLANPRNLEQSLRELGMSASDVDETLEFMRLGRQIDATELLDGPFRLDAHIRRPATRFSDGTWPVYYAARDWQTAGAEVGYHVRKAAKGTRRVYYQQVQCKLRGRAFVLLEKIREWQFLTAGEDGYPICQQIAAEAISKEADALLTPSARNSDGVNTPVFVRGSLSDAEIVGSVVVVTDGDVLRVEQN